MTKSAKAALVTT